MKTSWTTAALLFLLTPRLFPDATARRDDSIDVADAKIVVLNPNNKVEWNAGDLLVEEIEQRTRIRLDVVTELPAAAGTAVVIGVDGDVTKRFPLPAGLEVPAKADGYALWVDTGARNGATICVAGSDSRGALFGVGRLLRELHLERDQASLSAQFAIATAPQTTLRGHQMGYRPKTNSYDAWDLKTWKQYFRDMIVFGMNTVELVPPVTDDDDESPHFPMPKMEMMVALSQLADDHGLDVWIWYPVMEYEVERGEKITPEMVRLALRNRDEVLGRLPRVDAVFVPSGDPDEVHPRDLFPHLAEHKKILTRHHPGATIWTSVQNYDDEAFTAGWTQDFYDRIQRGDAEWLDGVVFGPATETSLQEMRKALPQRLPIRRYPDITHSRNCQYRVRHWDPAWEVTVGREPINPRPRAYAKIFRNIDELSVGFISYSEGCNDDLNKVLWSGLGWDVDATPEDIVQDYSRYFVGPRMADDFARGIFALEQNWHGDLKESEQPYATLELFREMEKNATPRDLLNWRFQQGIFRAYYDAYVKARLHYELDLKRQAFAVLDQAAVLGSVKAMAQAQKILERAGTEKVRPELRGRVFELGEALFQSVGMQLSVPKYQAKEVSRGAMLDTIDVPLNHSRQVLEMFGDIRRLGTEEERLEQLALVASDRFEKKEYEWEKILEAAWERAEK